MKLFLRDYILSLKEDNELDQYVVRLLRDLSIVPLTTPQKGRQFGVDIAAEGPDFERKGNPRTLFLFVIKQGNITRANWDGIATDVRPTLDEVLDFYVTSHVPAAYKKYSIKIVLVTNGEIKQNVYSNWTGYSNRYTTRKIRFAFWGTDKLTELGESTQFPESLFPDEIFSLLRRTMTVLMDDAYDYRHFYQLAGAIMTTEKELSQREVIKKIRLVNILYAMVLQLANKEGNAKPGVIIGERIILMAWGWLHKMKLTSEGEIVKEFIALLHQKMTIDEAYFNKVRPALLIENALIYAGSMEATEYALVCYEQLGILASYGHTSLWLADMLSKVPEGELPAVHHFIAAQIIADHIGHMIDLNPGCLFPKFDEHCIEINMTMLLFFHTERFEVAKRWLSSLINYLYYNFRFYSFVPFFVTDYEKLAEFEPKVGEEQSTVKSSILITTLAEWCIVLKEPELYENLREIVEENFSNIDLQLWIPDNTTEDAIYHGEGLKTGNSRTTIRFPKNHLEYEMGMAEENQLFTADKEISFVKDKMFFLGHFAFRHFRTYVFPCYWRDCLATNFCFIKPNEK